MVEKEDFLELTLYDTASGLLNKHTDKIRSIDDENHAKASHSIISYGGIGFSLGCSVTSTRR